MGAWPPPRRGALDRRGVRLAFLAATLLLVAALLVVLGGPTAKRAPVQGVAERARVERVGTAGPAGLPSYRLDAPDLDLVLPPALREVSGVTRISDTELACIEDEDGVVSIYDLAGRRIARQVRFGPPGDYEDLAWTGSTLFVLRSDGFLFELNGLSDQPAVTIHALRVPAAESEGLCHDARHDRLLVVPKTRVTGRAFKDVRPVFAFELGTGSFGREPVLELSVDAVRSYAGRQGGPRAAGSRKKGGPTPPLHLMPSAAAIHPLTSELFVLSSVDRVLVTFDAAGNVTGLAWLDPARFRQPEGLTFLGNGDLVITNEAAGWKPTLLLFRRRP